MRRPSHWSRPVYTVDAFPRSTSGPSPGLELLHALGNWVMTFDRIADRRLISSADNLRVLRYYSPPRALHNVIVSTEISRQSFRERLRNDIGQILPGAQDEALDVLIDDVRRRSAKL